MSWRLSFDLGTNSLGWAAFELENSEAKSLKDMGVRIFPDGREPAGEGRIGDPLNMARREARGARRNRRRKDYRYKKAAGILASHDLIPKKGEERKDFYEINPYEARAKAAYEEVSSYILGRALLNLSFHRGFKSNRKDSDDKESGKRLDEIKHLRETLSKKTLGEYLWNKADGEKAPRLRFRGDNNIFPDRKMIEDEFFRIKETQKDNDHLDEKFWENIHDAIFHQNPLKPVERGLCSYLWEQKEQRALKAQPSAERFRIWSEVNNLRWIDKEQKTHELTEEQKQVVAGKLLTTAGDVKFSTLLKLKKGKQPFFPHATRFNLEVEHRPKIGGAPVLSKLSKIEKFNQLTEEKQDELVLNLVDIIEEDDLLSYLHSLNFDKSEIEAINKIKLPSGTVHLSTKFMRTITLILEETGLTYDKCVPLAGQKLGIENLHHSQFHTGEVHDELPYYGQILTASVVGGTGNENDSDEICYGRISNPTVHVALNQLRKVINILVKRFGHPDEIVVEVGRELKKTREARKRIMKQQKENLKINQKCEELFAELGLGQPRGQDYKKFRLWVELGEGTFDRRCPFSGENISAAMLFTGAVQIEHILPYSRTLDNGFNNLTLAVREANIFKGNKTPYEAFGNNQAAHLSKGGDSDWSWEAILERASHFRNNHKANRFNPDAMTEFNEGIGDDFLERQKTDNAYIARISKQYLSCLIDPNKVWTIKGELTEKIRGQWYLNGLLNDDGHNKKNRSDHRHHAIDAFVLGLTTISLMQKVAKAAVKKDDGALKSSVPALDDSLRNQLEEKLDQMTISYKPDHGTNGKFFNETAYGFIKEAGRDSEYPEHGLVYRKPIESLTAKMVKHIRDPNIRERILAYIDEPQNSNKKLSDILAEFEKKEGVKKLRILEKNITVQPISSADYKGYSVAGYAYVDIWKIPKKQKGEYSYEGVFVPFYDEMKKDDLDISRPKPHPAAKYIMRLFKDDMVELEGEIYKVFGYSASNNKIDIGPQYLTQRNRKQNYQSINIIMPKGLKKLKISPDGRRL